MSADGIDFVCTECGKTFHIPFQDYWGQYDHGGEPTCPDCQEDEA